MNYNCSFYNMVIEESEDFVYLYNSLSGAFSKLEKHVYNDISNRVISDMKPCEYFDKLLQEGFIKPENLNEQNYILMNERGAVFNKDKEKITFVIAPTLLCNLNCTYCFESNNRKTTTMTNETVSQVVKFIENQLSASTKTLQVNWFGGEPLLKYDVIIKISQELKKIAVQKNISFISSMITNGILLNENKARFLSENCGLTKIQITVDGTEHAYCERKHATPQQYKRLITNIQNALKYLKISIRLNCDKNNFDNLLEFSKEILQICNNDNLKLYIAKLINYNNQNSNSFFTQEEFDKKRIEFDKFICKLKNKKFSPRPPKYRRSYCGMFKLQNLVIGPDGELYQCEHHLGNKVKICGNVWQGVCYTEEMYKFIKNKFPEKCKICKLLPLCLSGCPANKDVLDEEQFCDISEYYIKEILKFYIK